MAESYKVKRSRLNSVNKTKQKYSVEVEEGRKKAMLKCLSDRATCQLIVTRSQTLNNRNRLTGNSYT